MKKVLGFFLGVAAIVLAGNAESGEVVIGPGDSLPAAVTRARQAGVKTIRLKGGEYRVTQTIRLTASDTGLAFVAAEGEKPVLNGGVPLSGGEVTADGFRVFAVPKRPFAPYGLGMNVSSHIMLAKDGKLLQEATLPADGYVRISKVIDETNGVFRADFPGAEKLVGVEGLVAHGYWSYGWVDYALPVRVSRDDQGLVFRLDFSYPCKWPMSRCYPRVGMPFRLIGAAIHPSANDRWTYDRQSGRAIVRDTGNDDGYELIAFDGPFISADGTDGLRFSGISFRNGSGTGISVTNATGFVLEDGSVESFGFCGVSAMTVFGSVIRRMIFRGFGVRGLMLVGGDRANLVSGGNLVEDCDFSDASRIVRSCTHIVVNRGVGNTYAHNYFHDTPASAVRLDGNDNVFASNIVERCVTESDDWGAVENYGSPYYRGSRIFHNIFRDIGNTLPWNDCGQCGVRFDDMISDMFVYGNVFQNASRGHFGGVQSNGGSEIRVEHNLFIGCGAMFSVNSWSQALSDRRWKTLPSRDSENVSTLAWRRRYGDLSRLQLEPRRHELRHNVAVGCQAPVWLWGAGRCELISEYNQFLPADADLSGTGYGRMVADSDASAILEGIDPLPKESELGVRTGRDR